MPDTAGIILAAGRGSRMRGFTTDKPKCLVSLSGKPLLEWQLSALRTAGVDSIAVVRGYRGEMLDGAYVPLENPRWAATNMVASLLCAREWLRTRPCIVSYSDIVYHAAHVTALLASSSPISITYDKSWLDLWKNRFENPLGDAETLRVSPDGMLLEIGARAQQVEDIEGQYMGLLKFTPEGFSMVESWLSSLSSDAADKLDMTSMLSRLLAAGVPIAGIPVTGLWCEVDSDEDLELYEKKLREAETSGVPWSHDWR